MTKHIGNIITRNGAEIIGMTRWDERKLTFTGEDPQARHVRAGVLHAPERQGHHRGSNTIAACRKKVLRHAGPEGRPLSVADMRVQLGEDIRVDIATKLMTERGEKETEAAAGCQAHPHGRRRDVDRDSR